MENIKEIKANRKSILDALKVISNKVADYDTKQIEVIALIDQHSTKVAELEREYKVTGAIGNIDRNLEVAEELEKVKADLNRLEKALEQVRTGRIAYIKSNLETLYPVIKEYHAVINTELEELHVKGKEELEKLHKKLEAERVRKVSELEEVKAVWNVLGGIIPAPEVNKHNERINHQTVFTLYYINPQDGTINKLLNNLRGLTL